MNILFLQDLWYEWQAPMLFSMIAKNKGHSTSLIIKPEPLAAAKYAAKSEPDLIVFSSVTSGSVDYVYQCSRIIKEMKEVPIIVGGIHITLYPNDICMDNINYLGVGEGEITFSLFLDYLENKITVDAVPGLAYMQNSHLIINSSQIIENLDELPLLDRDLYYKYILLKKEKVRMFYSGRGCLHNCSYCCVPLQSKQSSKLLIRKKSPQNMIDEILDVKNKYGMKAAFFQDDSFTQDKQWLTVFLPLYKKYVKKPFMCMSRAVDLDIATINLMADNGCVGIGIGLETACESTRTNILNRHETNQHFIDVIEHLKSKKIRITTFNMLGIPNETVENIFDTILFNHKLHIESSWGVLFQPYKKTKDCNLSSVESTKNFYSKLGYKREDGDKIESIQRLFPLIVKFPQLIKVSYKIPKLLGYFVFAFISYYREINIWRRSWIITFIVGVKNQIQNNKKYEAINAKSRTRYKKNNL